MAKYLMMAGSTLRIGTYRPERAWYTLGDAGIGRRVLGTAAYYDRHARTWCVFAIDASGQQDGDAVYCQNTNGIMRAAEDALGRRWN